MLPTEVDVYTAANPFDGIRVHDVAVEGQTIQEMIVDRGLYDRTAYGVVAVINGEVVPDNMLERVRPKAGSQVILRVVPRGRVGKIIFGVVLSIITLGAGAAAVVAATTVGATLTGLATVGAGIIGLTSTIMNAVAPGPTVPFSGEIATSQDSPALTGTRNTARVYGPMRMVLGKYRVYPDLLGKPFEERVGKDSVLRLLMCFGYGPLDIDESTILIGDTPISALNARYKVHEGWDDDGDLEIFRDEVDTDIQLQPDLPRETEGGSQQTVAVMQAKAGSKEISLDFQFTSGLIAFQKSDGKPLEVETYFTIQHKGADQSTYSDIPIPTKGLDSGSDSGDTGFVREVMPTGQVSGNPSHSYNLTLAERGLVTRGLRWDAPTGLGETEAIDVKITRWKTYAQDNKGEITDENQIYSDARISVIRSIKPHKYSTIKNLAKIELEINASDTGLSNVVDNLSAVCTSYAPKWDLATKSWGPTHTTSGQKNVTMFKTRNAAWLFAHVLRSQANARAIPDARIDGSSLLEWAGNLEGTGSQPISGEAGLERDFDAVVDFQTTTRKLLSDIAGAGRAALNLVDGKYAVVQDVPRSQVIQHFSPRNSHGFSGAKQFINKPHALRVDFVNPTKNYQRDQLIVYNDGYSELGAIAAEWDFKDSTTTSPVYGNSSTWTAANASQSANGHAMRLEQNASSAPVVYLGVNSQAAINVDGSLYKRARIRIRRTQAPTSTQTWRGRFMWANTETFVVGQWPHTYSERMVTFAEPDWTEGWSTITIDLSDESLWVGKTITHIAFEASEGTTTSGNPEFEIDWIRIDGDTQIATEFTELSLWGVADAYQAWRDARYHMKSQKLRPETFSLVTDVEHLVCNRGDLVRVSHDIIGVGYGGARLTAVTNNLSTFVSGELDEEFAYEADKDYAIRIRKDDGQQLVVPLKNLSPAVTSQVEADSATAFTGTAPGVGDHVLFGEADKESILCLVQRISPRNDLTAQLELVEYNEAVYAADDETPAFDSNVTLENPPTLLVPAKPEIVGDLLSDESALAFSRSGTPEVQIIFNVATPPTTSSNNSATTHFHAQYRLKKNSRAATDWVNRPRVEATGNTRLVIRPVEEGEVYDIRVRAISEVTATASAWTYADDHLVEGLSQKPDPPTALSVWGNAVRWEYGERPADFAGFVVRHQAGTDATWATGLPLTAHLLTDNWVQIDGRIPPGETTIMVRAVDLGGNLSDILSGVRNVRDFDKRYEIAGSVDDWNTKNFADTLDSLTNCTVVTVNGVSELHADQEASDLFYRAADSATFWEDQTYFWTDEDGTARTTYKEMTYVTRYWVKDEDTSWPLNRFLPGKMLFSDLDIQGAEYSIEYKGQKTVNPFAFHTDWLPWPGERNLNELEYPIVTGINPIRYSEYLYFRVTIKGGSTQGKIKKARLVMEGTPKSLTALAYTSHPTVPAITGQYSLIGQGWRSIIGAVTTLVSNGGTDQAAKTVQVLNMNANSTNPLELAGPTFKAFDEDGDHTFAVVSFTLEGY